MKLFLDACVLYPALSRALLTGAAAQGLFAPLVSARVLGEWIGAAARRGGIAAETEADAAAKALLGRFPDVMVTGWEALDAELHLPDAADTHVLAAAATGEADAIVTFNLRDFPARRLAPFGIAARHPDGLLWELLSGDAGGMRTVIAEALGGVPSDEGRRILKRAQLPRLGKAWAA